MGDTGVNLGILIRVMLDTAFENVGLASAEAVVMLELVLTTGAIDG